MLLQDPSNMDSGHWLSVSCNKPKKEIYFFSTYGGKPDVEKISWMKEDDLLESGQIMNIFNDNRHYVFENIAFIKNKKRAADDGYEKNNRNAR